LLKTTSASYLIKADLGNISNAEHDAADIMGIHVHVYEIKQYFDGNTQPNPVDMKDSSSLNTTATLAISYGARLQHTILSFEQLQSNIASLRIMA
jgi:hypothetical protein